MAQDTVELIKAKLTIHDVVGSYVKLTRAGRHYRGLSPFNKEKTPSFYVNPERSSYYCFSSGQGGDMFNFIEKMEGVDFKGALKILADKAGVEIVYSKGGGEDKSKKDRLLDAMQKAEQFYREQLALGVGVAGSAHSYALSRGLSLETMSEWGIGFAPDGWRGLFEKMLADGFSEAELVSAGLIKEADEKKGTFYDRFRNRLMFPIRDTTGRTVAFTGRALDPNDQAKYLNSPETELYKKSEILFGMDKAKDAIRVRGFALLVEGQMDLLMLHQIGFRNTIALSGTALTSQHLALMKRYADNLMLALDADRAGLAASFKNTMAAIKAGMRVKAVRLPEGKDPADIANDDPKELTLRIKEANSIVDFFLLVNDDLEKDPVRRLRINEQTVLPIIAGMDNAAAREHYVERTSRTLGITTEVIRGEVAHLRAQAPKEAESEIYTPKPVDAPASRMGFQVQAKSSERFGVLLHAIYVSYPNTLLAERVESEYSRIIGSSFPDDQLPEQDVFEAGIAYGENPDEHAADELVRTFEKAVLRERLKSATEELQLAEISGDEMASRACADECRTIARQIASFS